MLEQPYWICFIQKETYSPFSLDEIETRMPSLLLEPGLKSLLRICLSDPSLSINPEPQPEQLKVITSKPGSAGFFQLKQLVSFPPLLMLIQVELFSFSLLMCFQMTVVLGIIEIKLIEIYVSSEQFRPCK